MLICFINELIVTFDCKNSQLYRKYEKSTCNVWLPTYSVFNNVFSPKQLANMLEAFTALPQVLGNVMAVKAEHPLNILTTYSTLAQLVGNVMEDKAVHP